MGMTYIPKYLINIFNQICIPFTYKIRYYLIFQQ